jgi:hypothetical protein
MKEQGFKNYFVGFFSVVLLMYGGSAFSQNWRNGITNDKSATYVATVNESSTILGKYCYFDSNTCMWILMNKVSCKEKDSYPALASVDKQALSIELVCLGNIGDGLYRYGIRPYEGIDTAITQSKTIGIVSPLADGNFRVNRFELSGMTEMHNSMIEFFSKRGAKRPADQTL